MVPAEIPLGRVSAVKSGRTFSVVTDSSVFQPAECRDPAANNSGKGELPIWVSKWPNYGFEEWFQLAALYPRLIAEGILTFIPQDGRSFFPPIGMEYVQWGRIPEENRAAFELS